MKRTIIYTVNDLAYFLSHRLPLALAARDAGFELHVAGPEGTEAAEIRAAGFRFHTIPLTRSGLRPSGEWTTLHALTRLYRRLEPDLVHHFTIKPILYGGLAARMTGVPRVVSSVTGLGYIFTRESRGPKPVQAVVKGWLRFVLKAPGRLTIVQNPDDFKFFLDNRLSPKEMTLLIKGSGVDMDRFYPCPEPSGTPVVLFPARMLWHKGLREFVEAARLIKMNGPKARFVLAGDRDPNPTSASWRQLEAWHKTGLVEWRGHCRNMPEIYAGCHIVCLPSYREGLPKALIEAAACGRPIVTTDVPGNREIVRHCKNGLLVPVKDVEALAGALSLLISDPGLRREMGEKARKAAHDEYGIDRVVEKTLAGYQRLFE